MASQREPSPELVQLNVRVEPSLAIALKSLAESRTQNLSEFVRIALWATVRANAMELRQSFETRLAELDTEKQQLETLLATQLPD